MFVMTSYHHSGAEITRCMREHKRWRHFAHSKLIWPFRTSRALSCTRCKWLYTQTHVSFLFCTCAKQDFSLHRRTSVN